MQNTFKHHLWFATPKNNHVNRDYKSTNSSSPEFPANVDVNLKLLHILNHHCLKLETI